MPSIDNKSKSQQNSISPSPSATPPGDKPPGDNSIPPKDKSASLPSRDKYEYKEIIEKTRQEQAQINKEEPQKDLAKLQERQSAMTAELDNQLNSVDRGQQPVHEQNQNKSYENPER